MARVRSLSNHPYRGKMRIKGSEYDADDSDIDLLVTLGRVVPVVDPQRESTEYSTRELHASVQPTNPTPSFRAKRRVREPSSDTPAPLSDES